MTFAGTSKQSLLSMYKCEHSPARTQMFWVECKDIPLFVATHLLRHYVGSQPYVLTHRVDRKGGVSLLNGYLSNIRDNMYKMSTLTDKAAQKACIDETEEIIDNIEKKCDRFTPTDIGMWVNAQSLIDMAKLRLCNHASPETVEVFRLIKEGVRKVDPDLANMMVRKCVYRNGLCGESCGFNCTKAFKVELKEYLSFFTDKQKGIIVK